MELTIGILRGEERECLYFGSGVIDGAKSTDRDSESARKSLEHAKSYNYYISVQKLGLFRPRFLILRKKLSLIQICCRQLCKTSTAFCRKMQLTATMICDKLFLHCNIL